MNQPKTVALDVVSFAQTLTALKAAEYEFTCLQPRLTEPFRTQVADTRSLIQQAILALEEAKGGDI